MKHILAIIQPTRLVPVKEALQKAGVKGMTVTEASGFGQQGGVTDTLHGVEYRVDLLPKIRIDVVVPDKLLDRAVEAIIDSARSGRIGDGKIFVTEVKRAYRIRTGERDDAALVESVVPPVEQSEQPKKPRRRLRLRRRKKAPATKK
ncbi:MAG: P-II family nitrogen regulator [Chloroflexi bacterium]|nr:P-II family nitrogen regulator [Chloroflexota bacterium]